MRISWCKQLRSPVPFAISADPAPVSAKTQRAATVILSYCSRIRDQNWTIWFGMIRSHTQISFWIHRTFTQSHRTLMPRSWLQPGRSWRVNSRLRLRNPWLIRRYIRHMSNPFWFCLIPINVALLRLTPYGFIRTNYSCTIWPPHLISVSLRLWLKSSFWRIRKN